MSLISVSILVLVTGVIKYTVSYYLACTSINYTNDVRSKQTLYHGQSVCMTKYTLQYWSSIHELEYTLEENAHTICYFDIPSGLFGN